MLPWWDSWFSIISPLKIRQIKKYPSFLLWKVFKRLCKKEGRKEIMNNFIRNKNLFLKSKFSQWRISVFSLIIPTYLKYKKLSMHVLKMELFVELKKILKSPCFICNNGYCFLEKRNFQILWTTAFFLIFWYYFFIHKGQTHWTFWSKETFSKLLKIWSPFLKFAVIVFRPSWESVDPFFYIFKLVNKWIWFFQKEKVKHLARRSNKTSK